MIKHPWGENFKLREHGVVGSDLGLMRQSRRRRGFDPRYRQFYGLFGRCQVSVRVRVRKKVHGERTEAMLEKKKNWSVFMVLCLPNPRRNKGAGVIPVALCLTYGGQVIVSLVTQDPFDL